MARGFVRVDREIELREENARLREALEFVVKQSGTSTDYNLKARKALVRDEAKQGDE